MCKGGKNTSENFLFHKNVFSLLFFFFFSFFIKDFLSKIFLRMLRTFVGERVSYCFYLIMGHMTASLRWDLVNDYLNAACGGSGAAQPQYYISVF
jgi:hypothetical protein